VSPPIQMASAFAEKGNLSMMSSKGRSACSMGIRMLLVAATILCVPSPGRAGDESKENRAQVIKAQLDTVNRQIDDAQRELSHLPNPNWCCCAGAFILAPVVGGIFWYLLDIKPKQDKKQILESRIQTLTLERQSLLAQLAALQ